MIVAKLQPLRVTCDVKDGLMLCNMEGFLSCTLTSCLMELKEWISLIAGSGSSVTT